MSTIAGGEDPGVTLGHYMAKIAKPRRNPTRKTAMNWTLSGLPIEGEDSLTVRGFSDEEEDWS